MKVGLARAGAWMVATAPLAFALYAPLTLLTANLHEIRPVLATRSSVGSLVLGIGVLVVCRLLLRSPEKAAVLATVAMLFFFSYGHVYDGLKALGPGGILVARHRYLVPVVVIALVTVALWLRRRPASGSVAARWMGASAWLLLAFPLAALVRDALRADPAAIAAPQGVELALGRGLTEAPDVFYIVLDGYGRGDTLAESYGLDNGPFLDRLRERGFFIAEGAISNYSRTLLSMASSLNMDYLDRVVRPEDLLQLDPRTAVSYVRENRVFELFRQLGYTTVAYETGYYPMDLRGADVFLSPNYGVASGPQAALIGSGLNEFEGVFLQTTMATVAFDLYMREILRQAPGVIDYEHERHRIRVLYTLESLSEVAARDGSHFVFAHLVSPHPPFVFGPRGEKVVQTEPFTLQDACCGGDEYLERYSDQLQYINGALLLEIDEILEAYQGNVILLLQGDHGPAGHLDWKAPSEAAILDRMAILSAYYLPGVDGASLEATITPVNTFRLILNTYFGGEFEPLEDVGFFTPSLDLSEAIRVDPSP